MKLIVSAMLAVSLFFGVAFAYDVSSTENPFENAEVIYVAPYGNDKGDGSLNKPLATAKAARDMARNKNTDKDLYVVFRGGEYNIKETLELNNQDSGKNDNKVIYTAYPDEEVIFNGGKKISGWKFYKDGIYEADVNGVDNFRELYVNGKRQQRASTKVIEGMGFDENQTAIRVLTSDLPHAITNQDCLETINTYKWRQYWLPVKSVFKEGNYTKLYYDEAPIRTYTSRFNFEWTGKTYFRIENALELLDEEGEWYFDKYKKKLYYKPETGEDITSSDIYAPVIEKFIDIKGEGVDKPVENIEIRNIKFLYGGWTYPSEEGYCSVQATSMVGENGGAYAAMTPGHIEVNYAKNIVFDGNTMAHMAATGINLENGVTDSTVSGNVFYDIGVSAITVGSTKHDQVKRIKEIPDNIITQNNVIRYAGMGFYGAPGITYYYTTNSKIIHNDIQNITYSGISIGWGWKDTTIQHDNIIGYNKIGNINTKVIDGAGIYSLSRNDNSSYVGNYVFGVNAPFNSAALYHDQNSCGFDDYDNVIDVENPSFLMYNLNDNDNIVIRDTYTNTLNIINYKRENKDIKIYNIHYIKNDEWPERAKEIMNNSGPQKEYYDEVYKKLATVEKDVSVRKPILKTLNTEYEEANLFYSMYQAAPQKEDIKAPYKEENGNVVIDAIDINGEYLGYDVSKKAFVGALRNKEWVGNYTARAAITVQACQYDIENAQSLTKMPRVGYKVHFTSPGSYHVFLRARALKEMTDAINVYLDDEEIGKLSLHTDYAWCNKNSTGELIMEIPQSGTYEIKLETMNDLYIDRLWLTQNPPDDLYDGSVISGPYASDRYSQATEYVNAAKKLEELPPELVKRVNVALNKPATASSYLELAPGYPPQKAVNGVFGDDWLTEKTNENAWWQVDLEKKYKITEIGLVFRTTADQAKTRRNFEVLASNDENFNSYTRLYTSEDLTVGFKEELSLPIETDESFQYIRVRKTALEPMGIAECRVYSEETNEFDISEAYYSSDKKGKYGVDKITDGNFSTYWSEGFKNNYWVKFKNKSDKALGKAQIYIRNDVNIPELYNDFEIRASNDYDFDSYVVLADSFLRKGNVLTATIQDPNSYKYIMVIKKRGFIGVSEVKLYERGSALEGE